TAAQLRGVRTGRASIYDRRPVPIRCPATRRTHREVSVMQIPARIGGRPVSADEWIEVLSPFDGAPVARVPALGADHVAEAVAAAEAALGRGDFPRHRRAEVLERAAELLAER